MAHVPEKSRGLTDAISRIADKAHLYGHPMPHILMPRWVLNELRRMIEAELGMMIYRGHPLAPIQYDGVTFAPLSAKPRVRVQAGRRVISWDKYFWHGAQWTPEEIAGRWDQPPIPHRRQDAEFLMGCG